MKKSTFFDAVGGIDGKYIEEAENSVKKRAVPFVKTVIPAAACLCIIMAVLLSTGVIGRFGNSAEDNANEKDEADHVQPTFVEKPSAKECENVFAAAIKHIGYDWPEYGSPKEIVGAATDIFSGKVTDISFEIIDGKTGTADRDPNSESSSRMLYTVYTVELKKSYKGSSPSVVNVYRTGGLEGYAEETQSELMISSGLYSEYGAIPVCEGGFLPKLGEEYLFCTSRYAEGFYCVINLNQFAFEIGSKDAKKIISCAK